MQIVKKKISELNPAMYNPRKKLQSKDPAYQKLKKSIETFGYVDPIIYNVETGNIVGGHQRLQVLQDMGHTEIDVVEIAVDGEKERALNLALNKISGDWDRGLLKDLLQELDTGAFDMDLTGFDAKELEKMMVDEIFIEQPEMEFTEELMEEHNYVVLYFDNKMDWQQAVEKLGIHTVHAVDSREGYERKGIGRVLRGIDIIERL